MGIAVPAIGSLVQSNQGPATVKEHRGFTTVDGIEIPVISATTQDNHAVILYVRPDGVKNHSRNIKLPKPKSAKENQKAQ
jgi:hypothetical protein